MLDSNNQASTAKIVRLDNEVLNLGDELARFETIVEEKAADIEELNAHIEAHDSRIENLATENKDLSLRIAKLERMASLLLDVRGRAFLTYQRDHWRDQLFNTLNSRIHAFNKSILHDLRSKDFPLGKGFSESKPIMIDD